MTLATAQYIVDRASQELGIATSSLTPGVINQIGSQSLALLNSLGDELVREHGWQFLEGSATIIGDGTTTEFSLPEDFGRIVNQTAWSASNKLPMNGPLNAQVWGWIQHGIVSVGIYYRYRILNNKLVTFPAISAGEEVNFYYIKKNWVHSKDGVSMVDTITWPEDRPAFDRSLMIKGLKNLLWGQKGFDTTELARAYNSELSMQLAQNQGAPVIDLSHSASSILITTRNVPDGNW
jgi:hypothetical protein